jgi:alanine dehydrogenase
MTEKEKSGFSELAHRAMLMPQESTLEIPSKNKNLFIGIPKETSYQENRITLTPMSVGLLVNNGHEVYVETGAGNNANFFDTEYSEAGAKIVHDVREVYSADIIMKVAPPSLNEINMMQPNQTLFSTIHHASVSAEYLKALTKKKITAVSYEFITDESGIYPVVQSMSEIVGPTVILIAAEYLSKVNNGKGAMLGGISGIAPTEIVIIGAGTVAEYAARTALGLGAQVKVFDDSLSRLRRLQNNLGHRIFTSVIQPEVLKKALRTADVAIGAIRNINGRCPCIVNEEMVKNMRAGSVIIDVSIDGGGCFETSEVTNHSNPVFKKYDVIHYCVPNIASRVSRTASYALTNIFTPILLDVGKHGGVESMLWEHKGVRHGVYTHKGNITNKHIADIFNLPFKDLDLIMAARI